jgi:hypothetical protein
VRAVTARGFQFAARRIFRHHDGGFRARLLGRDGDGLGMIAR